MYEEFAQMARQELVEVLSGLPADPLQRTAIFIEALRALDYCSVFQQLVLPEKRLSAHDFSLIQWGWNLAAQHLLAEVAVAGVPIYHGNSETRSYSRTLLNRLGRVVLLQRASDMIRYGFLDVTEEKDGFTLRKTASVDVQFLDQMEFSLLEDLESSLNDDASTTSHGWGLIERDSYDDVSNEPGSFMGRTSQSPFDAFYREDLDELMLPLIFPWDSGKGIMMGYHARQEVDDHFLAAAMEMVVKYREEAGIHPDAQLGDIRGADLTTIIAVLTSLHMKHVRFALLAMKNFPTISIPESLTIWGPFEELVDCIADCAPIDRDTVRKCLEAVTWRASETKLLEGFTTPFLPLLVDLGNGLVLRPVSSLNKNPFLSTKTLLEWRDPSFKHQVSEHQEEWLRSNLYGLFKGSRYLRVPGSIKIREGGKIVTDLDAAIFDITTGELAIFQLKWQDYFTNDVRKLRSKASNLARELDEWAEKLERWVDAQGTERLITSLQLKLPKGAFVTTIYLFGISRDLARTHGYGFSIKSNVLAVANWPQFLRTRMEIGPSETVFHDLFFSLKEDIREHPNVEPLPMTIEVGGKSITFQDLWNSFDEANEG